MSNEEYKKIILPFLCFGTYSCTNVQRSIKISGFNLHTHLLLVPLNITRLNFTPCIHLKIQKFVISMKSFKHNVVKISTFRTPGQITGNTLLLSHTRKLVHTKKSVKATETSPWQSYSFQGTIYCAVSGT
jgi:hypothetical protein